ncbi:MAG: T9SS C-terminal target domain-containing protein [Calditrichaeota bacterium]|nr:MAG: T9SS C-terminal target domain-containing protein [Calditrichota bacterium]MBL1204674.1 T9SS C-terminal target domain-containing protein [Calditrichota bacterium]NOG44502.1 T9SS type A sorting domain-containing protein [Calditrichota bacterium]
MFYKTYFMIVVLSVFGFAQDERWSDAFVLGGFDGYVYATAVTAAGDIYVAGEFNLLNGIAVNGIAMWDGDSWSSLGNGVTGGWNNGIVYSLTVDGNNVYVGGDFTQAGDVEASRIAMWDGDAWHAFGSGVDGEVYAIAVDGGNVYVGGYNLENAGGVAVNNVAMWDGNNWNAMGDGVFHYDYVDAMIARNDTVYVGGNFQIAGEDTVNYITYWDGDKWNSMDGGMSGRVNDLTFGKDVLYATGDFKKAGDDTVNFVAQWDGVKWSTVGNGLNSTADCIFVHGDDLYVGGRFFMADTVNAARITKWDGSKWHSLGAGIEVPDQLLSYRVFTIGVYEDHVYAGGNFEEAGNKEQKYFAMWNGQSWSDVGKIQDNSVDGDVFAIVSNGTDVYVGGQFTKAGGDTVNNIAKWDGQKWHALGEGLNNKVNVLAFHNGNLYAGGIFSASGDKTLIRIAMWDGEKWNSLSEEGINNQVYAMAFKEDTLYVGGNFTSAGDIWARRVAKWDGVKWHALGGDGSLQGGGGLDGYPNSYVNSINVDRDTVYIGGYFGRAFYQEGSGYINVQSLAKWDGREWHALGRFHESISRQIVSDFTVKAGIVHVAGSFPRFGDNPATLVKKWDGQEWSDIGDEFYYSGGSSWGNKLKSIVQVNGDLFVAGEPDMVGEKTTNYIVKWDGDEWLSLGSGTNDYVYTMAADSNFLFVGGRFSNAGNKGSNSFARYDMTGITSLKNTNLKPVDNFVLHQNYPNPFNPKTTLMYQLKSNSQVELSVFNILGQKVKTLVYEKQIAGNYQVTWDSTEFSSGIYFYQLKTNLKTKTKRMLLIK